MHRALTPIGLMLPLLLAPAAAFAFLDAGAGISVVGGALPSGIGGNEAGGIVDAIAQSFRPIISAVAGLGIVLSGTFLLFTSSENMETMAKRVGAASVIALILANVAPAFQSSYFALDGTDISTETEGLLDWAETILGAAAVVMIIISGARAIIAFGTDDGINQLRRTVIYVVVGIILIVAKVAISGGLQSGSPNEIIGQAITTMNKIVGFMALVAVGMIVLAGLMMIANIGNEEQYDRAKKLIFRVGIGLVVILVSAAITNVVLSVGD